MKVAIPVNLSFDFTIISLGEYLFLLSSVKIL